MQATQETQVIDSYGGKSKGERAGGTTVDRIIPETDIPEITDLISPMSLCVPAVLRAHGYY